jgi:hypothetical protein
MKAESSAGGKIPAGLSVQGTVRGGLMEHPDVHLDYVRARHSDLLRLARAGELAARVGESRRYERRTVLERLRRSRRTARATATG